MTGLLHSIQSLGTLDGPGLRTVVILQGCAFRCKFCHSIDTTLMDRGEEIEPEELVRRILKNRPYWRKYYPKNLHTSETDPGKVGGVTITGGDPAINPTFLLEVLKLLKKEEIHTAVETPLHISKSTIDMLLPYIDLWMISLKHIENDKHFELTGLGNSRIHENIQYLDNEISLSPFQKKPKIRFRYVVIPGLYDDKAHMQKMGRFISNVKNIEEFELLKYVTLGRFKWIELFGKYELDGVPDATKTDVERVADYLKEFDFKVVY